MNPKKSFVVPCLAIGLLCSQPARSSLVAGWHMDESSGPLADVSGNGLAGTPSAGGLTYGQASVPAGTYGAITVTSANATAFGTSINFTRASSGGFTVGGAAGGALEKLAEAGPSTGKFTAMAWINSTGLPASTTYRVFGTGPTGGWGLGIGNVDRIKFTTFGNTDYLSNGTFPVNGNWHHLAVTWNNGVVTTYVDGNVAALNSAATTFTDEVATTFRIGGNANGTDYFNGRIDELKIYDTAMTASEIIAASVRADPEIFVAKTATGTSNGTPTTLTIPIQNIGATQALTFTSATLSGADAASFAVADISPSIAPGGSGSVTLSFTPSGTRTYVADLNLASNDPLNPIRVVGVSVTVIDPTAVVPASLDFGSLPYTPGVQQLGLTIHNSGGVVNLQVLSAVPQTSPSRFSVASLPAPIAPGADGSLMVAFDPGTEGGGFFDRLVVTTNDPVNPVRIVNLTASVAFTADTAALQLTNGNFNANTWNSQTSTAATGWSNSAAPVDGLYGQTAPATPNLTSIAAHFKATGGLFIQQPLANANPGLKASGLQTVTIGMDVGYRNDSFTGGDIVLRVSLIDLTTGQEVAGRNIRIADTGVKAGTASNQLAPISMLLAYDSSSFPNDPLALQIRHTFPVLPTGTISNATAIVDNVTLAFTGTYTASAYDTWASSVGLTSGNNAATADPDGDGGSNFQEFAFGGNPLSSASRADGAGLTVDTDGDSQQELILTLAARSGAEFSGSPAMTATVDGITYTVEGTTDLASFTEPVTGPLNTAVIPAGWPASPPAGYTYFSFKLVNSVGLPGRGFIRARASQAP